jgi:hypothetical protein
MLTKTLAWAVILVCVVSAAWWFVDPVGFSQNPVFSYFKRLSLRSSGYYR